MQRKAVALLSGGLDSTLAIKLMLEQGIAVEALNFTSPFCTCTSKKSGCKSEAVRVATEFSIPIKVVHKGLDYLQIVRNPRHGYGKGLNPCIDCRIFLLQKAKEYMVVSGADFVITGEVLGQRPMSQRRDTLRTIERESGLEGLLLRPLSAQFFPPTIPEQEGWVDRSKLLALKGRSRSGQIKLAEELDVRNYPCPAGGCLLTETAFIPKLRDIFDHSNEELDLRDFRLLKIGRHFRLDQETKLIVGRDEADNSLLDLARKPGETALRWVDGSGPLAVVLGKQDEPRLQLAARILLRFTRAAAGDQCTIRATGKEQERTFTASHDFSEADCTTYRI